MQGVQNPKQVENHWFRVAAHTYLNFVSELFDLVDGSVVLVGELPQFFLAPLRHLLQMGALILCVTERALQNSRKKKLFELYAS